MAKKETQRITAKSVIMGLIAKGKTDEVIISETLKKVADSGVTPKHCTKYRKLSFNETGNATFAAFGSSEHQTWGNDSKNAKTRISAKCPHAAAWKERIARNKAAEKKKAA